MSTLLMHPLKYPDISVHAFISDAVASLIDSLGCNWNLIRCYMYVKQI